MTVPKKTVLLVEDDAIVRDIIRSAFEREYIVLEASGCSEAEGMLSNTFDIALIDYMLPDGDGISILKAIRQVNPKLPAIIMTAFSSEDVAIKALQAAATDYVKKPLVLSSLRMKVANLLEGKKGEAFTEAAVSREEFLLESIAAFMEEHYADELTRDDFAERVGMNKYKFSRTFNDRYGQNIKSYVNTVRVKKAAALLRSHDINIGDIAFSVGFGSVEHFIRVFKEIYGISPTKYRDEPPSESRSIPQLWDSE